MGITVVRHYGYNMDIMQESACLVVNPITFYSYGFLFNCIMEDQEASRLNDRPDIKL